MTSSTSLATAHTTLTVASLAVSLFLITSLSAILRQLDSTLEDMGNRPILVVIPIAPF